VLVSLCHVLLRWFFQFIVLRVRSKEFKELEIIVLRGRVNRSSADARILRRDRLGGVVHEYVLAA
jgi:hypothetical protein